MMIHINGVEMDPERVKALTEYHAKRARARSARVHADIMYAAADALEAESADLGAQGYVGVFGAVDKLRELAGAVRVWARELEASALEDMARPAAVQP